MKLIHTADLHLGHHLSSYARTDEHAHFFDWLLHQIQAEAADALIISGNVFATPHPSAEAQRLFFDFLCRAVAENEGLQVVITAGSQDDREVLAAAEGLLRHHNIYVRGSLRHNGEGEIDADALLLPLARRGEEEASMVCFALPFLRRRDLPEGLSAEEGLKLLLRKMEKRFKKSDFSQLPTVLSVHVVTEEATSQPPSCLLERVPLAALNGDFAYTALGGVSKGQSLDAKGVVRYAGSPLALSFAQQADRRSVVAIELTGRKSAEVRLLEYRPLCSLETLPSHGAATPAEAQKLIAALPQREGQMDNRRWPYLEINLHASDIDDALRRSLFESLEQKAVCVCRVATVPTSTKPNRLSELQAQWRNLTPLELAHRIYRERNGQNMSADLTERFQKAEAALHE